ncbi:unnamed protein product [Medioppia subpectinata]|uniref:C2H2-type domain-containing protein n=1 Tax=Medioppia subpectinata TaxID=1979941 RepID=A0A7R9PX01_9ACAR|nr:unnamed protein product [Medioppia subpectinata]CAG2103450.1 unnamed protein product [Medioppia subpectinata]
MNLSKRSKRGDQLNGEEVVDNREDNTRYEDIVTQTQDLNNKHFSVENNESDNGSDDGVDCNVDNDSSDGSVDENEGQRALKLNDFLGINPMQTTDVNTNGEQIDLNLKQKMKTLFKTEVMAKQAINGLNRSATGGSPSGNSAAAPVVTTSKGMFACGWPDCDFTSCRISRVEEHKRRVHTPDTDGQYNCKIKTCPFRTPDADAMADHWSAHKTHRLLSDSRVRPDGMYPCGEPNCDLSATTYQYLVRHQLRMHPDAYPYCPWIECPHTGCQYRTKSLDDQKRHENGHKQDLIQPRKRVRVYPTPKPIVPLDHRFGDNRKLVFRKGPDGRYACPWVGCTMSWIERIGLINHWRRLHTPDPMDSAFACPQPLCTFRAVSMHALGEHTDTHIAHRKAADDRRQSVGRYECDYVGCGKQFIVYDQLLRHQLHRHPDAHTEWPWFECPHTDCEFMTKIKRDLKAHSIRHKKPRPEKPVFEMTPDGQYICDFIGCEKRFNSRVLCRTHKLKVHRVEHSVCGINGCTTTFNTRDKRYKHQWRMHNQRPHHCGHPGCKFSTGSAFSLKQHLSTHTGEKPFRCELDDCGQAFRLEMALTEHQKRVHWQHFPDLPWIQCSHTGCEWRTKIPHDLTIHTKSHTKPYKCSQCDKCFGESQALRNHRVRHDDSLKIPCHWPGCDKRFVRYPEMKRHLNAHSGERVYRCVWPGCDKQYLNEYSLSYHQKSTHNKTTDLSKRSKRRDQLNGEEVVDNTEDNRRNKRSKRSDELNGEELVSHREDKTSNERLIERLSVKDNESDNGSDDGVDCNVDNDSSDGSVDENEGQRALKLNDFLGINPMQTTDVNTNGNEIDLKLNLKQKLQTLFRTEVMAKQAINGLNRSATGDSPSGDSAAAPVATSSKGLFACGWPDCDFTSNRIKKVEEHKLRVHTPDADGQYNCKIKTCPFRTPDADAMADHWSAHRAHRLLCESRVRPDGMFPCGEPNCDFLGKEFRAVVTHQLRMHPNAYLYCPWIECPHTGCQYRTKLQEDYKRHENAHKQDLIQPRKRVRVYLAPKPTVTLDHRFGDNRKLVFRKGRDGRYACPWIGCTMSWIERKGLLNHWRRHHTPDPMDNAFACPQPLCTFRAVSMHALGEHTDTHIAHRKAADARRQSVGKYECDYVGCGKQFIVYDQLLRHQLHRHPEVHTEWPWFECPHTDCEYMTKIRSLLRAHRKGHKKRKPKKPGLERTPDGQYICDFIGCEKRFKSISLCNGHKRRVHRVEHSVCGINACTATFNTRDKLSKHKWRMHNQRPHQCGHPGCHFSTGSLHTLKKHRLTHTADKPFRCELDDCGQAFRLEKMLTDHQKRVHWQHFPHLPWFQCSHTGCEWRTKIPHDLTVHTKSHTKPYKCSQCDKCFGNSDDLRRHRIRHDDSLKIPCHWPGCDKKFVRLPEMKRHLNAHSGERVYRCLWPGCDKHYLNEYSLSYHEKTTHNKTTDLSKRSKRGDQLNGEEVVNNREDNRSYENTQELNNKHLSVENNESDDGVDCNVDNDSSDGSVDENEGQRALKLNDFLGINPMQTTDVNTNGEEIDLKLNLKQKLQTLFKTEVIAKQATNGLNLSAMGDSSSGDTAVAPVPTTSIGMFACGWPDCDFTSNRIKRVKAHKLRFHTPDADGQYNCKTKTCPFRTPDADAMADHWSAHKTHRLLCESRIRPDGMYPCGQPNCDFLTNAYRALVTHQLRVHPEAYPHCPWIECPHTDCQYRTKRLGDHKRHENGHKQDLIRPRKRVPVYPTPKPTVTLDHRFGDNRKLVFRKGRDGRYACPWVGCTMSWNERMGLTTHWRRHHTPDPTDSTFACPQPLCTFRAVSMHALGEHTDTHIAHRKAADARRQSVGRYQCDYVGCGKQFIVYDQLLRHQLHRHPEVHTEWPWFECPHNDCEYMTKIKRLLQSHSKLHKKPRPEKPVLEMTPDGQYICDFIGCEKRYKSRVLCNDHKRRIHRLEHSVCGINGCTATFNTRNQRTIHKWRMHNERAHQCGHPGCHFSTGSPFTIKNHRLTHTGDKPFLCELDDCGQAFRLEKMLTDHQKRVHWQHFPDLPWIQCSHIGCEWRTKISHDLTIHTKSHTKPYKCSQCEKSFGNSDDLRRHRIRHDDSLKIPCHWPGCDKKFVRLAEMKRHLNAHSGERVYRCLWPGCDKQYLNEYSLSYHEKTTHNKTTALPKETVHRCHWPECDYKTKNAGCLTNHLNKHQGIADYHSTRIKPKT